MPQPTTVAIAQPEQSTAKPSINPDAFYRYAELEELGLGKYLKWRRAIIAGRVKAYYSGRLVLVKGSDALSHIGVQI